MNNKTLKNIRFHISKNDYTARYNPTVTAVVLVLRDMEFSIYIKL